VEQVDVLAAVFPGVALGCGSDERRVVVAWAAADLGAVGAAPDAVLLGSLAVHVILAETDVDAAAGTAAVDGVPAVAGGDPDAAVAGVEVIVAVSDADPVEAGGTVVLIVAVAVEASKMVW
jgi:hypothetical protein